MALAFLKHSKIQDAFIEMSETAPPELNSLFEWFSKNYIGSSNRSPRFPAKLWSCFGFLKRGLPRSTNGLESWHRNVNNLISKKHPGVLYLINFLKLEVKVISQNLLRFNAGHPWHVRQKLKEKQREERIQNIFGNRITMDNKAFLRNIALNIN